MTKEQFLEFHTGYFGEPVNDLKQISKHCFNGTELFEYINEALRQKADVNSTFTHEVAKILDEHKK